MSPEPLSPGSGQFAAADPTRAANVPAGWTSTLPDQDPTAGNNMPPPPLDGCGPSPSVLQPPPPPGKSSPTARRASGADSRRRSSAASSTAATSAARPAAIPPAPARRDEADRGPTTADLPAAGAWNSLDAERHGAAPTHPYCAQREGSPRSPCYNDAAEEDQLAELDEGSKNDEGPLEQRKRSSTLVPPSATPSRDPPRRKGMTQKRTLHLIEQYKLLRAGEFARHPSSLPSEFWERLAEVLNQPEMMDGERERALSGPMVKHRWDYLVRLTRAFSWALDPERWPGTTLRYNRARGGRLEGSEEDWRRLREDRANREKADLVHQAAFVFYEEMRAVGGGQYTLRTFEPPDPAPAHASSEEGEMHRLPLPPRARKRSRRTQELEHGSEDEGPHKVRATAAGSVGGPMGSLGPAGPSYPAGPFERGRMYSVPTVMPVPPPPLPGPHMAPGLCSGMYTAPGAVGRGGFPPPYIPRQGSHSYSLDSGKPYNPRLSTQSGTTVAHTEVGPRGSILHTDLAQCSASKNELAMSLIQLAQERHKQRARFLELMQQPEQSKTESRAAKVRMALRSVPPELAPPSAVDHWLSQIFDPGQRDLMRSIALLYDADDAHSLRLVCGKLTQELGVGRVPVRTYSDAGPSHLPHPVPLVARHASTSSLAAPPAVPSSLRHSSFSAPFQRYYPGPMRTSP